MALPVFIALYLQAIITVSYHYRLSKCPQRAGKRRCPRRGVRPYAPAQLPRRQDYVSRQAPRRRRRTSRRAARPPSPCRIGCAARLAPPRRAPRVSVGSARRWCREGGGLRGRRRRASLVPAGGWVSGALPWREVRCVSTGGGCGGGWGKQRAGGALC